MSRNFLNEYFTFSPSARRGLWVLIVLIIVIFLFPRILPFFEKSNQIEIDSKSIVQFDSAFTLLTTKDSSVLDSSIHSFDPNKIKTKVWIKYGASKQLANRIENYIQKKGHFRKSEDVLKIYGFDSVLYKKLSPYFKFDQDTTKNHSKFLYIKKVSPNNAKIEINSADSAMLDKLPLIGKVLSVRIIKYRNKLGGFYDINQLKEVYGLNEETYLIVKNKIYIDTSLIIKLDLNNTSESDLRKHPYIGKYKASLILKYRKFKGHINSLKELTQNSIFNDKELEKLRFYFK